MKSPKLQPGLTAPPKRAIGKPRKPNTATELEAINPDPNEVQSARRLKDQLTIKELKFLEIYFLEGLNMDQAMISAGYVGYHPKSLYRLGRKLVEKFENQAGDRRNIFRAIGAGEVTIIRGLLEIAQDPKVTAAVRLRAWSTLASCLGLKSKKVNHIKVLSLIYIGPLSPRPGVSRQGPAQMPSPPSQQFRLPDNPPLLGSHLLCHLPGQLVRNSFVAHPHHRHKFSGSSQYPENLNFLQ